MVPRIICLHKRYCARLCDKECDRFQYLYPITARDNDSWTMKILRDLRHVGLSLLVQIEKRSECDNSYE